MPDRNSHLHETFKKELAQNPGKRFELLTLMGYLNKNQDREIADAANQFIEEFYAPLSNEDGSLNKEAFEELFEGMTDYRIRTVLEPTAEFIRQDNRQHSDLWLYDHINNSKAGVIQHVLRDTMMGFFYGDV